MFSGYKLPLNEKRDLTVNNMTAVIIFMVLSILFVPQQGSCFCFVLFLWLVLILLNYGGYSYNSVLLF